MQRRRFLRAGLAMAASAAYVPMLPAGQAARVLVLGGGWAGLAAARELKRLAPEVDITLVERQPRFFSLSLSSKWLAGQLDEARLLRDYAAMAAHFGYRYLQAEVLSIDRAARTVDTSVAALPYDWLILAAGIRHDYAAWFAADTAAARQTAAEFGCAYRAGDDQQRFKARLLEFARGTLVMNIPPMPYRCPPAPYERALWLAQRIKQERLKAKLVLVDPGAGVLGFRQLFAERYSGIVTHLTHAVVRAVDPFARKLHTEFDEIDFDTAVLMPPQQASDLAWQAGLIGRTGDGQPSGWADQEPVSLQSRADERIFVAGDLVGMVSPLFGQLAKSGHVAARLGAIAAANVAARIGGGTAVPSFADNVCYVQSDLAPPTLTRIETRYRRRGDGVLMQEVRQIRDPQPRGEDEAWLDEQLRFLSGR